MRVTQNMLNSNMLYHLQRSNSSMSKYMDQLSTGKKINKASDDPVTAVRSMYYRSSLSEVEQFKRNLEDGLSWMSTTDEALDQVNTVVQRVRELTVQGLSDTNDSSARQAISEEIKQLKEHLGEISNSQIAGRYVFAGTDVKIPPFRADINDPNSQKEFNNTNQETLELQVGQTNHIQINVLGTDVFNNDGKGGIFLVLTDIVNYFESPDNTGGESDHLDKLDSQINNILKERSELGARMNRLELSTSKVEALEVSTTKLLSSEEDVDISQVIIDLKAQENVHSAALSAGARIIQPTLLDFLR